MFFLLGAFTWQSMHTPFINTEIAFAFGKMLSWLVDSLLNTGILTNYDSGSLLVKFVFRISVWLNCG